MILLILVIVLGLAFDFVNGFHDAANSIATIVTTRVLTPLQAVIWAAAFNFIAFFIAKYVIGEFGIADTVSKVVMKQYITMPIILSGLIAAITWNLFTWREGIPSSSSHTLIGGFAGAAICGAGFKSIASAVILKIIAFIVLAPLIGMIISSIITIGVLWTFRKVNARKADNIFRKLQLVSSGLFSLGHGMNDSQKVMGVIATAMIFCNKIDSVESMPDWVPICCFVSIGLGTVMGGWRIVKTMGNKITKVTPLEGVCAETAGAITLFITEILKVPVSTTHTITGSIMGVGAVKRLSAVRWNVSLNLLWAWILTIPVSAILGGIVYLIFIGIGKLI